MVAALQPFPRRAPRVDAQAASAELGIVGTITPGFAAAALVVRGLVEAGRLQEALEGLEALVVDALELLGRVENARGALVGVRSTTAAQVREASEGR